MSRPNVVVTPYETIELNPEAFEYIDSLSGKIHDKRTRKGKAYENLIDGLTEASRVAFLNHTTLNELIR